MKSLSLGNNTYIPQLGFGTYQMKGSAVTRPLEIALEVGFRHIDTADRYGNQREIGVVLEQSGIERGDLFLTSKIWLTDLHPHDTLAAGRRFLDELRTDYLDLLLIHWPDRSVSLKGTLEAMQQLKEEGAARAIGASNFTVHHLQDALQLGFEIVNNQIEFHPSLNQSDLKQFCDAHKIIVTAYSPLAQGQDLSLPQVMRLAEKYSCSASQVILNWILSKGIATVPKAADEAHIRDNFASTSWEMEDADRALLDSLHTNNRVINPTFGDFDY